MKKSSAGFIHAYLLIILFVLGAVVGAYLFGKNQITVVTNTVVASPTPKVDEAAGWLTYANEEFNFSFKYPPIWFIKTFKRENNSVQIANFYKEGEEPSSPMVEAVDKGNQQMIIWVETGDFDELKKKTALTEITIDGKRALSLSEGAYILVDSKNKKILKIFRYPDEENYMSTILTTFKFN